MHFVCTNTFGAIVLKLRFKIDVVVMIIWSVVVIINSVLTLQVSTASLPHDREPCEIKVVSNHTCSLHTCVCAGSRRVRIRLNGFQRQGISSTPGGFVKCPIPVRVWAEQLRTLPRKRKQLGIPFRGTELEAESSFPNPSAEEKTTRNSVPNHSTAEETTLNKTRQRQSPKVVKLWVLVESGWIGFHQPG